MASIRRISIGNTSNVSKLSQEVESIGRQLNPSDQNTVSVFQNTHGSLRNNGEERITLSRDFLSLPPLTVSPSELAEDIEDSYRKNKAEIEGRLNGPLSFNQLKSAERFIEEAYFLLPIEYKNEAAKQAAEYQRRQYLVDQIVLEDQRLTEVSQELSSPETRPDFEPLKDNITIILLKAPKQQSNSAKIWFENIKSKLNHQVIFDQSSVSDADIRNALGTLNQNEQVRVYVERNYSAVHWKTITKDETEIISNEIENLDIYWDDYPLFQNIENELFLREKEEIISCDFIDYEANNPNAISEKLKLNPINFASEWILGEEYLADLPNYNALLKKDNQENLILDNFLKFLNDITILNLLENTGNFYSFENNEFVSGNSTSQNAYELLIKPYLKYKIADKLYKHLLKESPLVVKKFEIGIFKQLESEGYLNQSEDKNSNVRVFYIKDEEAGELISKSKTVLNNYLEKYKISYKEIILSDGIETLPLEGLRSMLVNSGKHFYRTVNNLIMKRFKTKDFMLKYYYNYIVEDLESNISEKFSKTFTLPRNLIIKTKEDYFDNYGQKLPLGVRGAYAWGQNENEPLAVYFNNKSTTWLNSDLHCLGFIHTENTEMPFFGKNLSFITKIFPVQLIPEEFEIAAEDYNENYHFTFYSLYATLFHEEIHVLQTLGPNGFLRNRTFDSKEVLFEDKDSLEREFLLSKDLGSLDLKQKFFYLARYVYESLEYEYPGDYLTNPEYNGFTGLASFEDVMDFYKEFPEGLTDENVSENDFILRLSEELYYFYSRYKGFVFAKGSSYISRFLENIFTNEYINTGALSFVIEGTAVFLTKTAFSKKFTIVQNELFKTAKTFFFLTTSQKYREYLDIIEKFNSKISELNGSGNEKELKSILNLFEDTTTDNYIKDDYFKEEEHIEESFRIKDIFYSYEEIPDYKKVFEKNDRFNTFSEEVERNLSYNDNRNSYRLRLRYRSVAPTPAVQQAASPAVSPQTQEPRTDDDLAHWQNEVEEQSKLLEGLQGVLANQEAVAEKMLEAAMAPPEPPAPIAAPTPAAPTPAAPAAACTTLQECIDKADRLKKEVASTHPNQRMAVIQAYLDVMARIEKFLL